MIDGRARGAATADLANPLGLHKTGLPFTGYGAPSKYEKYVVRNIGGNRTPAGYGVSWTPLEDLEGIITPSGLHFERHHDGVSEIDPALHRLVIHGLVRQPLMFTVESLLRYPMRSQSSAGTKGRSSVCSARSTASSRVRSGRACRFLFCSIMRASTRRHPGPSPRAPTPA
jgi:hypothetical protein